MFIQELHKIAEDCEYGTLKEELIRDRIVVGVLNEGLSDRLQLINDLTLKLAVQTARQSEARKENRAVVRGEEKSVDMVRDVQCDRQQHNRQQHDREQGIPSQRDRQQRMTHTLRFSQPAASPPEGEQCRNCGCHEHRYNRCPAEKASCNKCHRIGHYSKMCRNKKVLEVATPSSADSFLGELVINSVTDPMSGRRRSVLIAG